MFTKAATTSSFPFFTITHACLPYASNYWKALAPSNRARSDRQKHLNDRSVASSDSGSSSALGSSLAAVFISEDVGEPQCQLYW